jgi:hypothetical protein
MKASEALIATRILLAALVAILPFFYAHELELRKWWAIVGLFLIAGTIAFLEIYSEVRGAAELERMRSRLEFQKARGLAMKKIIELLKPTILIIESLPQLTADQKSAAASTIRSAWVVILQGVCEEVRAYYREAEPQVLNSSLMLAYEAKSCPAQVADRVMFKEFGRGLESYKSVLDVVEWAYPDPQFRPIALPVEDASNPGGRSRLLPGAPTALALGTDQTNPDLEAPEPYAAPDLDKDVLRDQREYFETHGIRSMANLVLSSQSGPIGILNVHSKTANMFASENKDGDVLIKSIEHYRYCLQYLVEGQRKLQGFAS